MNIYHEKQSIRFVYVIGTEQTNSGHPHAGERGSGSQSCSILEARFLFSPDFVQKSWRVPEKLLVFTLEGGKDWVQKSQRMASVTEATELMHSPLGDERRQTKPATILTYAYIWATPKSASYFLPQFLSHQILTDFSRERWWILVPKFKGKKVQGHNNI